ncbi:hypothetical protein LOTGIDRAFT_162707 [Lottia gigantea]|uniref:F-box domain-containing protein n=1 Tax=Lottia gigantea TaxID=225164 RepID=V4AG65_LOTGI|nr:hypothetical protein LOTGIDRAFT_162707 [Lottia gigantea]ESO92396.1 hypothetical protein LOTGIDRAFT_162707 [Lottia gigantea]
MGVSLIISESGEDTDSSDGIIHENTPASAINRDTPTIPLAPRILKPSQRNNCSFSSPNTEGFKPIKLSKKFRSKEECKEISGSDYINKLLDENILNIFHLLPRFTLAKCARVCRRWSHLVKQKSLWRKIDLSNNTITPSTLSNIVNRGVKILRLAKSEILGSVNESILGNQLNISNVAIQYLDLSMAIVPPEILEQLFSLCHNIKKLSLENCKLTDSICRYIGQNSEIESLNLTMCQGITHHGMEPILNNCNQLECLNISWTWLNKETIEYISNNLPNRLVKLNWSGCRENITDNEIMKITDRCKRLKELDLSDSTVITCLSVHLIASNLHQLEHLALSRCYSIIPTTIPVLSQLESLSALEVFGMLREVYLTHLQESMPSIEINSYPFSSVARPTTGVRRTSIWGIRVRESAV